MAVNLIPEHAEKTAPADNVCFCWVCKSLLCCYLACLAIPLMLLTGVVAAVLMAFLG